MKRINIISALLACVVLIGGCEFSGPSHVSLGMARLYLKPGKTTRGEVLERFGGPNDVSFENGQTTFYYNKVSSRDSAAGLGIGGGAIGGSGGGLLAGGIGSRTRSETSILLIIYLDEFDVVRDYRVSQSKY